VDTDPGHTERRLAALGAFGPDPFAATAFEDLTRVAADLVGMPMAAISVLNRFGGHIKAAVGIAGGKRSADAFATWALCQPSKVLVIEDAAKEPEMQKALSESGLASVRFLAAVPLILSTGEDIGALCVMADSPREVPHGALENLRFLGDQVIRTLEERQRAAFGSKTGVSPPSPEAP
jgi:GAF domain-containing protein